MLIRSIRAFRQISMRRSLSSTWNRGPLLDANEGQPSGIPEKLKLNFFVPHETIMKEAEVKQVTIPGLDGVFGVLAGHVPTVAELAPGVVEVFEEDLSSKRYFVSGGFAFIHEDSTTDISAVEAVPVEDLDPQAVQQIISEAESEISTASDDKAKAVAQIKLDVGNAMSNAVKSIGAN